MESLQLQQALVDAGMPPAGTGAAKSFLQGLSNRLGLVSSSRGLKQQFFDLLTHLLGKAPSLACSWLADYLAFSTTLVSSDPEEAYILQPQSVLAWSQHAAAGLRQRVDEFLRTGPSARVNSVLELQQTAQSLLAVATAVKAVSSTSSSEVKQLIASLTQLQQATKVLQVLEQLQQQQLGSPTRRPHHSNIPNGTPASSSAGSHFGQQPLFKPRNTALSNWQQQLQQRRAVSPGGHLFLNDVLAQLQQHARLPSDNPATTYPYQDVLTCIRSLFVSSSSSSGSSSREAWHAKLAVLLYYLLDGGWLSCAEPFAQGFQLPLTMVQQWQCHHLLDAAAGGSSSSSSSSAALDKACQLLGAIACPTTPFRFVEALLQAGRPATALAVQRARCAGGGASSSSSSLNEAEVLLRVELGGGLLAEAFCDLRRHCNQVPMPDRTTHINTLMRQLVEWALTSSASTSTAAAAAATASRLGQQLQLHDHTAATAAGVVDASSSKSNSRARQQQLLQLPLDSAEECVLVAVLRERMAAGKTGGHLLPLYLLQRGRTLEALDVYADYRASPSASGTFSSSSSSSSGGQGREAAANEANAEAASRALLHKRLDAVMAAAAAALPPALRAAATAAGSSNGSDGGGSNAARPVLQGLGGSEVRRLQGGAEGAVLLQQRGVEPPAFLAPLLYSPSGGGLTSPGVSGAAGGVSTPAATAGRRGGVGGGVLTAGGSVGGRSAASAGTAGRGGASWLGGGATAAAGGGVPAPAVRPLLFEDELAAEAGPVTVRLGGKGAGEDAGRDIVPLLFGTPAPGAGAAAGGGAGRTPGAVRGGMFDTPLGAGGAMWGNVTPGGPGVGELGEFAGMSEADFERQVRFATPQPSKGAGAAGGGGGVFTHTGRRQFKRMRM